EEKAPLPDLIITDGGKGQMGVVKTALDELRIEIPIAGLAKDERHKTTELLYGFPAQTIGLEVGSGLFKLMERIQDEVHRFAIQFHRDKRSKRQVQSELDNVAGIGPKTKQQLLKHYGSIKRIRQSSQEELVALIGKAKGLRLWNALHNKPETKK
ncbi:MAG: helix-hairpin-helix domain-containing protein, partial [Bacteroides sp.]